MRTGANIHETDGGSVTIALPKDADPTAQMARAVAREKLRQKRLREREEA